jgi:hypothetical protein
MKNNISNNIGNLSVVYNIVHQHIKNSVCDMVHNGLRIEMPHISRIRWLTFYGW